MSEAMPKVVPVMGNPEVVKVLMQMLEKAQRGEIDAVALVGIGRVGVTTSIAGGRPIELYAGCGLAGAQIMDSMRRPSSPILRPV